MNHHTDETSHWHFYMIDKKPGPSVGDAAELIELLGFDPWALQSLTVVAEACEEGLAACRFEANGRPEQVNAIRAAFERLTDLSAAVAVRRPG